MQVLAEIPAQVIEYMKMKKLVPGTRRRQQPTHPSTPATPMQEVGWRDSVYVVLQACTSNVGLDRQNVDFRNNSPPVSRTPATTPIHSGGRYENIRQHD